MQQVQNIAVRIAEECQRVSIHGLRFRKKGDASLLQSGADPGEIGDREREMAEARSLHPVAGCVPGAASIISIIEPSAAFTNTVLLFGG